MFRGPPRAFAAISRNPCAIRPITSIDVTKSTLQKMNAELLSVFLEIYITAIEEDWGWRAAVRGEHYSSLRLFRENAHRPVEVELIISKIIKLIA